MRMNNNGIILTVSALFSFAGPFRFNTHQPTINGGLVSTIFFSFNLTRGPIPNHKHSVEFLCGKTYSLFLLNSSTGILFSSKQNPKLTSYFRMTCYLKVKITFFSFVGLLNRLKWSLGEKSYYQNSATTSKSFIFFLHFKLNSCHPYK